MRSVEELMREARAQDCSTGTRVRDDGGPLCTDLARVIPARVHGVFGRR